jgi:hypothetical protein
MISTWDRAYHQASTGEIHVDPSADSTVLHELGHRMEHVMPDLLRLQAEFYARRTRGNKIKSLAKRYPGSGYKLDELTREDKFTHAYIGKDYQGRAFEVLTMGLEGVWYKNHGIDPTTDRDLMDFIVGLLATA